MSALLAVLLTALTTCKVARVVDGDTVVCRDGRNVRLLLVDAPEARQVGGAVARAGLTWLVGEQTVRLEFDRRKTDKYGRTLAYVWKGEMLINEEMARQGLAVFATYAGTSSRYEERVKLAIDEAKHYKRGIWAWAAGSFCSPADYRRKLCP